MASPMRPARPTRPILCTYASFSSGSVTLMTNGTPWMSIPRAATSVQIRNRTSPLCHKGELEWIVIWVWTPTLNFWRLSRLSSGMRSEWTHVHEYSFVMDCLPPPQPLRKSSRLSQSIFVRQNMMAL